MYDSVTKNSRYKIENRIKIDNYRKSSGSYIIKMNILLSLTSMRSGLSDYWNGVLAGDIC